MVSGWIEKYGLVLAVYIIVAILIYVNRKKFEFQGKIIAIYKTKVGISLMEKIAKKCPKLIRFIGNLGIYIGFMGMLAMIGIMGVGIYQLMFVPEAPPMFSPVLPGVSIPGSPVTLPLIEGIIALFIVVVIHEFTHGVISKSYKIPVISSGLVMFGPIPGAFVEPDEKKLKKAKRKAQLAIFAGGPFANIILAVVLFGVILGLNAVSASMYSANGVEIGGFISPEDSAQGARLGNFSVGEVIYSVNNISVVTSDDLFLLLTNVSPGDVVIVETDEGVKSLRTLPKPENESMSYLGFYLNNHIEGKSGLAKNKIFSGVYFWILGLIIWICVVSLGIGIVNLLPLGPMDGGRMYLLILEKYFEKEKAHKIWSVTSFILVFLLIILIFVPIAKAIMF